MILTKQQRKHLVSLAHTRKPVVRVGQKGLSENITKELDIALQAHELVKIKIAAADTTVREEIVATFAQQCNCECIQLIGHNATVFRRNTKKPVIVLPD